MDEAAFVVLCLCVALTLVFGVFNTFEIISLVYDHLSEGYSTVYIIKYRYLASVYRYNIATQSIAILCCIDYFPHRLISSKMYFGVLASHQFYSQGQIFNACFVNLLKSPTLLMYFHCLLSSILWQIADSRKKRSRLRTPHFY